MTTIPTVYAPDEDLLARALFDKRMSGEATRIAEGKSLEDVYRVLDVMWEKTKLDARWECSVEASLLLGFYREALKREVAKLKAIVGEAPSTLSSIAQRTWNESTRALAEAYRSPSMETQDGYDLRVDLGDGEPRWSAVKDEQTTIVSNGHTFHKAGEHAWSL